MTKTYEELVPPEMVEYLLYARDKSTEISWQVGDIALECIRLNPDEPKMRIYSAIASFWGKSARSVRDCAMVSDFYPELVREEYSMLSFSHMRYACGAENWREILDWAVDQIDELGRPATVDALMAHFGKKSELNPIDRCIDEIQIQLEKLANYIPPEQYERIGKLIKEISDYLKEICEQNNELMKGDKNG